MTKTTEQALKEAHEAYKEQAADLVTHFLPELIECLGADTMEAVLDKNRAWRDAAQAFFAEQQRQGK